MIERSIGRAILTAFLIATVAGSAFGKDSERVVFERARSQISFESSNGSSSLSYPKELGEALFPYAECTVQSAGQSFTDSDTNVVLPPDVGKDCTTERKQAREQSIAILRAEGIVTPKYQETIVSESLDAIDKNAAFLKGMDNAPNH